MTATLHPYFLQLATEVIDNNKNLSVIYDHMAFNKVKTDCKDEMQKLLSNQHFRLFMYPGSVDFAIFLVNDSYLVFRPLTNNGVYDHTQLISNSQEAVEFGREIFDYYLKESAQITEL